MLAIKNNIMAANAARHLGRSFDALAQSVERLASGLRINTAKDDAAGLAVYWGCGMDVCGGLVKMVELSKLSPRFNNWVRSHISHHRLGYDYIFKLILLT